VKIKKGDKVVVLAGKDRGKTGTVTRVLTKKGKVVVAGVNIYKKHLKPSRKTPQGGIIDFNAPMDISNVALICPNCGKKTRVGYRFQNQKKIRICKKCQKPV